MRDFFVLSNTTFGPTVTSVRYKHVECDLCGIRPIARVGSTAVRFDHQDDLVDITRTADGVIVRRRVAETFEEKDIAGWRSGALEVAAAPELGEFDLAYCELVIIGHSREYASLAGLQIDNECPICGRRSYSFPQQGIKMPERCWDGSDIFVIDELPGLTIVTDLVRRAIEQYRLTGVECIPIAEWSDPLGWLQDIQTVEAPPSFWPPLKTTDY
jgi:hypothetical protein